MSDDVVVTTVDTLANPEAPAVEAPKVDVPKVEAEQQPEKTFTQADLEKQIGKRLAREQTKYQRELQAEREARIRLEERLAQHKPEEKKADGEPQLTDYDDFQKYSRDLAKWVAKQELESTLSERDKKQKEEKAHATQQQMADGWNKKVQAALKDMPDYVEVVSGTEAPMSQAMQQAIMESDQGPKLAYHLATHPDEAAQIAAMTPFQAVRALTLIEAGFKAKSVTQTPAPETPIGSRQTSGVKSLVDIKSQAEFEKRRREFRAGKR